MILIVRSLRKPQLQKRSQLIKMENELNRIAKKCLSIHDLHEVSKHLCLQKVFAHDIKCAMEESYKAGSESFKFTIDDTSKIPDGIA